MTGSETEQITNRKNALSRSTLSANENDATRETSSVNLCPPQNPAHATVIPMASDAMSSTAGRARTFVHRREIRVTTGHDSIATRNKMKTTGVIGLVDRPSGR